MNNNLFPNQIFLNVAVFDPMQGKLVSASNGVYPFTSVDTNLPPVPIRIDKTHIALSYVDLSGDAHIATLQIPNNTTQINLLSDVIVQSQVTAFRITKSWNGDDSKYNVPKIIAYAGFTNTSAE